MLSNGFYTQSSKLVAKKLGQILIYIPIYVILIYTIDDSEQKLKSANLK